MKRDSRHQTDPETFDPNDLDWKAFLYISDELETDERESFESLLESDEAAQQALVAAVQQTQLIYSSATLHSDSPTSKVIKQQVPLLPVRPPLKRPSVLFAAAAAMLLLVGAWSILGPSSATTPEIAATADVPDLAEAWADTLVEKGEPLDLPLDVISDEYDEFGFENDLAYDATADSTGENEVEDWMFVALTGLEPEESLEGID